MNSSTKEKSIDLLQKLKHKLVIDVPDESKKALAKKLEEAINELQIYQAELEVQNEELRQVQNDLEKNRNKYFELFNNAPIGYFLLDSQYMIIEANNTALGLLGQKRDETQNRPFLTYVNSKDHRALVALLNGIEQTRKYDHEIVLQLKHKTSRYKTVKIDGRSTFTSGNSHQHIMLTATDLTEMHRTEEALKESETLYRSLVHSSLDHIFMLSTDGYYLASNDNITDLANLKKGQIVGKSITELFPEANATEYIEKLKEVVLTRKPVEFEFEIQSEKDSHYFREKLYPVIEDDGLSAIGGISQNITLLKKAEQESRLLQSQLRQTQKLESLGNLAGGIAHDFNNILSAILGFSELAMSEVEEGTTLSEDLLEIQKGGKRAKDLVQQILLFARQTTEEIHPTDVAVVANEVVRFIGSTIPANIEIRKNLHSTSYILGNATQIYQVLLNLCTNAYQAMDPEGGVLSIEVTDIILSPKEQPKGEKRQFVEIKISDTGTGIDPAILDYIFDPYFTTKQMGDGSGMGLALVHSIIESYQGEISVESTVGKGTTFIIQLPADPEEATLTDQKNIDMLGGSESILFVDDEFSITRMNKKILEKLGYTVTTKTNAVKALQLFEKAPDGFDLVITDMTMPYLTGDKLAQKIMAIKPDIPVILCTGYNKNISTDFTRKSGIKALVQKPFHFPTFSKIIREALDRKK